MRFSRIRFFGCTRFRAGRDWDAHDFMRFSDCYSAMKTFAALQSNFSTATAEQSCKSVYRLDQHGL